MKQIQLQILNRDSQNLGNQGWMFTLNLQIKEDI